MNEHIPFRELFEGLFSPAYPMDYFDEHRISPEALKIAQEMIRNPEKFGSVKIKQAIKYLREEFKDLGGMIQVEEKRFREQRGQFSDLFALRISKCPYDEKVLSGAGLELMGSFTPDNYRFTSGELQSLRGNTPKFFYPPRIYVSPNHTIHIEPEVFNDATIRLGLTYNNCHDKRDIGLGRHLVPGDNGLANKLVFGRANGVSIEHWDTLRYNPIGEKESWDFTEKQDPYLAERNAQEPNPDNHYLLYVCDARLKDGVLSLQNKGPDIIPLAVSND